MVSPRKTLSHSLGLLQHHANIFLFASFCTADPFLSESCLPLVTFFFKHSQVKIVKNVKRCDGSGHFACGDIFHLTHTSLPKSAFGKFCFFLHHFQFNKEKRRDYGSRAILASRLKHFPILWEHYSAALMWLFTTETSAKSCNKSFESGPSVPNLDVKVFVTKLCNCSLLEFENLWFCIKKKDKTV